MQVWEAASGERLLTYRGHAGVVCALAWSPDGRWLASAGGAPDKTVQVWEAASGERLLTYRGHQRSVHGVAWSPDGRSIVSVGLGTGENDARRWEVSTGEDWLSYEMSGGTLAWSPDGKRLAIVSVLPSLVEVWDADSGKKLAQQDSQEPADRAGTWCRRWPGPQAGTG